MFYKICLLKQKETDSKSRDYIKVGLSTEEFGALCFGSPYGQRVFVQVSGQLGNGRVFGQVVGMNSDVIAAFHFGNNRHRVDGLSSQIGRIKKGDTLVVSP